MKYHQGFAAVVIAICCLPGCWSQLSGPYVRNDLQIRVVVKYPEAQLTAHGNTVDLLIVGNGLGLAWNEPTLLTKTGLDTWTIDLHFNGSMDGYGCDSCTHSQRIRSNTNFEYRIMTGERVDMIGANFGMAVPMSKIERNFPIREYLCYPFFFTSEGSVNSANVTSTDSYIGTRRWSYYLPPSFHENTYKKYPTIFAFDLGATEMLVFRLLVEQIVVGQAIAEEAVIIGSADYGQDNLDRTTLLSPTPGVEYFCHNGDYPWVNRCDGCIPEDVVLYDREMFEYMRDKCGYPSPIPSKGEEYLDYMKDQVLPTVHNLTSSRLLTDRSNLGVGGCSLGGLLACHALWTRAETYGTAACTSTSFWWPTMANADNGFDFLNITLKNTTFARLPQKVYIDVTDLEDGDYYAQVGAALTAVDVLTASSPEFRPDETLWFTLVNGQQHGGYECLTRTWIYMNLFLRPGGAPRNPDPPVKVL